MISTEDSPFHLQVFTLYFRLSEPEWDSGIGTTISDDGCVSGDAVPPGHCLFFLYHGIVIPGFLSSTNASSDILDPEQ